MSHEFTMMNILLRCSIFALLVYKGFFLFQQYVIPWLRELITAERNHLIELLEKQKLLASTRKRLETQIYNQQQRFTLLEHNMHRWHQAQVAAQEQREQEQAALLTALQTKLTLQARNIAHAQALQVIIPDALDQAEDVLMRTAAGSTGNAQLTKLIAQLTPLDAS